MFTQTFRWSSFYHIQSSRHRRPIPFRCLEREATSPREPRHSPTRHPAPRSVPQSPTQFEHVRHTEFSGDTHESLNPPRLYGVTAAKAAITESLPLLLSPSKPGSFAGLFLCARSRLSHRHRAFTQRFYIAHPGIRKWMRPRRANSRAPTKRPGLSLYVCNWCFYCQFLSSGQRSATHFTIMCGAALHHIFGAAACVEQHCTIQSSAHPLQASCGASLLHTPKPDPRVERQCSTQTYKGAESVIAPLRRVAPCRASIDA